MTKYNFGCGPNHKKDYINVDALSWETPPDIIWDLTKTPYLFAEDNSADEINATEVLEHLSFKDTINVVREWKRILKSGGKMTIQVPDCGLMMRYYSEGRICECVPHKSETIEGYKAKSDCPNCEGRGMINPTRWLYSFIGAQKHIFDYHRQIFTNQIMCNVLDSCGFSNYTFKEHPFKLIVTIIK